MKLFLLFVTIIGTYGTEEIDGKLQLELVSECKLALTGNRHNASNFCRGIFSEGFRDFVKRVGSMATKYREKVEDLDAWWRECRYYGRAHDPPVCTALAYSFLPFNVSENAVVVAKKSNGSNPGTFCKAESLKLKVFSVETDVKGKQHCPLMRSAAGVGVSIDIIGTEIRGAIGPAEKLVLIKRYVENIPKESLNSTILLFVDSRDVLIQGDKKQIIEGFVASDSRILFNSEGNCFPFNYFPMNMMLGDDPFNIPKESKGRFDGFHICGHLFPSVNNTVSGRWLNSGAFVGYADSILKLLNTFKSWPKWFLNNFPGTDQGFFTQAYLSHQYGIKIDTDNHVFAAFGVHDGFRENYAHSTWERYVYGPYLNRWNVLYARSVTPMEESHFEKIRDASNSRIKYLWVHKPSGKTLPVIHLNGNVKKTFRHFLDDPTISKGDHALVHSICNIVYRIEATMYAGGSNTETGTSEWAENVWKAQGIHFNGDVEALPMLQACQANYPALSRACAIANDTLPFFLNPNTSGLGNFLEFSPVRIKNSLGTKNHVMLARGVFGASQAIGPKEWIGLVEDDIKFQGKMEALVRHHIGNVILGTRKIIAQESYRITYIWFYLPILLVIIALVWRKALLRIAPTFRFLGRKRTKLYKFSK
ncbi:hypothetical protein AAMO2058_001145700 [Amorphochlora amoebiformis]